MAKIRTTVAFTEESYARLLVHHKGMEAAGRSKTLSDTLNFLLSQDALPDSRKAPPVTYQVIDKKSLDALKRELADELTMSATLLLKETVKAGFHSGFRDVLNALSQKKKA